MCDTKENCEKNMAVQNLGDKEHTKGGTTAFKPGSLTFHRREIFHCGISYLDVLLLSVVSNPGRYPE